MCYLQCGYCVSKLIVIEQVDEVLAKHSDFLNSCLHDCLLSSPQLLATVKKLLNVCSDFALYMQVDIDLFIGHS